MASFFTRKRRDSQNGRLIEKSKYDDLEYGTISEDSDKNSKVENEQPGKKARSLAELYRYASAGDILLIIFGIAGSIVNGAGLPMMSIIFGGMANSFIDMGRVASNGSLNHTSSAAVSMNTMDRIEEFNQNIITYSAYYAYMGIFILASAYVQTACWMVTCERQIHRIRKEFFKSILRQEIAWFDERQSGELTTQLSDNLDRVKEGIGDKLGLLFQYTAQTLAGYVIAFVYNWKLTLVMMSLTPAIAAVGAITFKMIAKTTKQEQARYGTAGAVAKEVLSCIRTVIAFNGQAQDRQRYENSLKEARATGVKKSLIQGVAVGLITFIVFGSYSLALWFGGQLISWGELTPGTVFIVLMSVMGGTMSLGNISPQFAVLAAAKGSAAIIFEIIDSTPTIDPYSTSGIVLDHPKGKIEFDNVTFSYPTRKEWLVLNGVSFNVEPGQCVAVVGSSGCGKSTMVNLLLRYYDVDSGQVSIDGISVKELNVWWLRNLIAVVSQEPVLFDATIEENIQFGKDDVTNAALIEAAKMANAHGFICGLPEGYRTRVGEGGLQLSGGQKQRIAIARALVRKPKILLLDEATSALDAESESLVQEALDTASQGRTTIVIAHRLSTIRNADKIMAFKDGKIAEVGTHQELMEQGGVYHALVTAQTREPTIGEHDQESEHDDVFEEQRTDSDPGFSDTAERVRKRTISRSTAKSRNISGHSSGPEGQDVVQERKISRLLSNAVEGEKERLEREAKEERAERSTVLAILKENSPEWLAITLGLIGSMLRGVSFPIFALFYSQMFSVYGKEGDALTRGSAFWSIMMLIIGVITSLAHILSGYAFGISSENLTMRLRLKAFTNVLRQDGSYFDHAAHVSGKLCTRLATDAPMIKGAVDIRFGTVLSSIISMITGIAIGFLYGWQLTLLMLLILPLFALGTYLRFKMRWGGGNRDALLLESAGQVAAESIWNIRTVQALTRELTVYEKFCNYLQKPYKQALRSTQIQAISYAFSQCIIFFFYAACFRFGAYLVTQGAMEPLDIFKVFFVIMFSGMTIGWATAYFPEMMKARIAAGLIMKMINETPKIDSYSPAGLKNELKGSVSFDDVHFAYPTRPHTRVFRGLSFKVPPGRTVALVGASGCGKSTVFNLLERFYDPLDGRVLIDDSDLRTLNIHFTRAQMAIVSQEPTLYDCSIHENIAYGANGVAYERIVEAATMANIHNFITGLPQGYATRVGEKGVKLSAGQKQRIAIARALIRDPKILLLDEATSALDTESEKVVQEALDTARKGRTCIIIAHRLSTVQNADRILVIKNGRVVEQGTHSELMNKQRVYYELTRKQKLTP